MTALADRREGLLDALYAEFGEAAGWRAGGAGAASPCTVRRRTDTAQAPFGDSAGLMAANLLKIRVSEIPAVERDDTFEVALAEGGAATFQVIADPQLVKSGLEWVCEVKRLG